MHRNLTPDLQNKLLGWALSGALLLASASGMMAQETDQGSYQGPGISSPGVGSIGSRSGEQVDLRYYLGISGVFDNAIVPFATDAQGNLIHIPYLYGIEVGAGVYGVHHWKRSQLGLDYAGSYTRYFNYDAYNSTNHALTLGYTDHISRRLNLDLRESAGSLTYGTGQVANLVSTDLNSAFTPATRLFNSRTYFLQSLVSATYLQSARMSYTAGASAFLQNLKSRGLSNGWGYSFNGNMMRRMSKSSTLGVTYAYSHFEFPGFFSKSNSHIVQGLYATGLGRFWTLSIEAGATVTSGESQFTFALNPVLAALFGQSTVTAITSFRTIYPSGTVALKRQFRRASLGFDYYRGVNSGNGAYTTGRLDNVTASISYTGLRKVNMGASGGYYTFKSIGQSLGSYAQFSGGAGISYSLGRDIHLSLRYDLLDQQIDISNYRHTGSRATVGLNFSPGSLPLSLW
ncbi:MAG TPA: hypothetical protein VL127_03670 [Bryobacteraceae bacterium]|nr:hypothetical protein [Bryobacteraceae bacterium]